MYIKASMSRKFLDFSDDFQIVSLILNKEKYLIEQWCKGTTVFLVNHVENLVRVSL